MGKDADRMDRVDVCDHVDVVAVCVLVLEQKSAEVRLASLEHLFDGGDDGGVADDDGFVKAWEQGSTGDG